MAQRTMLLSLDSKETTVFEYPDEDVPPQSLTPPSFPKNLTDTQSPKEAKKWKNGRKGKTFGRKGKNAEIEGKYDRKKNKEISR